MDELTRTVLCMGVAVALVLGGTVATGVLPSEPGSQAIAGAMVVAGFAVPVVCFAREQFAASGH